MKYIDVWKKQKNIFSKHWSQLPIVDVNNENYWRIYYSHRIDNKSYPKYFDVEKENPEKIINICEQPLIEPGELGSFDQAGVMPTEIISHNGIKYLYYIGWTNRKDVPYFNTIGLALSYDQGKTYKKFSTGPVFGCSYKEPGYTGTIKILVEDGIWKSWYLSCRKWLKTNNDSVEPLYDIKYAESKNGIDWEPSNITCIPLKEEQGGISQASVLKVDKYYYMWYSYRNKIDYRIDKKNSYKIGHARSLNGKEWDILDTPVLEPSDNGWDSLMVEYPSVIKGKDFYYMFYNGNGFGKEGIGYAITKDPFSVWE